MALRRGLLVCSFSMLVSPPVALAQGCERLPSAGIPAARPNDNRAPAGTLRDGVLTLRLEIRAATWHPDGEQGCGVTMHAFAEEGAEPQIPGPLIRVPVGTELRVSVRNTLAVPLTFRGLQDHSATLGLEAPTQIQGGDSASFAFRVGEPGNYYYFAKDTPGRAVPSNEYAHVVGGFIVDPAEGTTDDRVFILTRWRASDDFEATAFNGLSWPHTERITATVGDEVRWRVIAATANAHAMHLHGFFFEVESRGDVALDTAYVPQQRRSVVTELMTPGSTMTLRWTPQQTGNWIFHCHMMRHMSAAQRLDRFPGTAGGGVATTTGSHASHAMDEMAGLVLGITVRGGAADAPSSPTSTEPRKLHLFANGRPGVFGDQPGHGFVLQEGEGAPATDSVTLPGTPLILTRDEPVEITVTNRLPESLAIHWHGIELESYYDGVAGWSGIEGQIAPAIPPGTSSIVRFTPPRAGTFIYHVHNEAGEELSSGLYGPLIVLEPGSTFDPGVDRLLVVGEPGPGGRRGIARSPFVNGAATPAPLQLEVGRAYRLRLISIPADDLYQVSLVRGDAPETWRPLAQDGADLSPEATLSIPAVVGLGPGMTFDFELVPASAGDLSLLLDPINPIGGRPMGIPTRVPIQVRGVSR